MINNRFEKIYCINLDKRIDRWDEASALFLRHGVAVLRVPGKEDNPPWNGLRKTVIEIFRNAIDQGLENILILEDDIEWPDDFTERFDQCWNLLPNDWDMFYFSAAHQYWPNTHNDLLFKLVWSTAAHAIGFNKKCFNTVLFELESNNEPIDVVYSKLQQRLNAYCCIEPIAWQRRSYSDIEGKEKWYPYLKDMGFYNRYMQGLITLDGEEVQSHPEGNQ